MPSDGDLANRVVRLALPTILRAAREAVANASLGTLGVGKPPKWVPGTVSAAAVGSSDVTVRLDPDTNSITAQNLCGFPLLAAQRVMVLSVQPHGVFVTGLINPPPTWIQVARAKLTADGIISFTNIPQIGTHLRLSGNLRSTRAAARELLLCRINNDGSALYDYNIMDQFNATPAGSTTLLAAQFGVTVAQGATAAAGVFSHIRVEFANYTSTSMFKAGITAGGAIDLAATDSDSTTGFWQYRSLTAVSRIDLFDGAGGTTFLTGSDIVLEMLA